MYCPCTGLARQQSAYSIQTEQLAVSPWQQSVAPSMSSQQQLLRLTCPWLCSPFATAMCCCPLPLFSAFALCHCPLLLLLDVVLCFCPLPLPVAAAPCYCPPPLPFACALCRCLLLLFGVALCCPLLLPSAALCCRPLRPCAALCCPLLLPSASVLTPCHCHAGCTGPGGRAQYSKWRQVST